jgi:hypothetical protein
LLASQEQKMSWDRLETRDIAAFVLLATILVGAAFLFFKYPLYTPFFRGQGWECVRVPKGGLTCDKTDAPLSPAPR